MVVSRYGIKVLSEIDYKCKSSRRQYVYQINKWQQAIPIPELTIDTDLKDRFLLC